MTQARVTEIELTWRASPLALVIATCAAVALVIAVLGSRWQMIAFAAPLLGVLCSIGWQHKPPVVRIQSEPGMQRCFESESTQLSIRATTRTQAALKLDVVSDMSVQIVEEAAGQQTVSVSASRWGHYPVRARVSALGGGGLLAGTATVDAADVYVFPVAPPQSTGIPRTELLDRLGTHLTRHLGPGVEYADIRGYVPGDQLRTVNWPVSARRGSLHVTQRLTDRAADVVVLVDAYPQPPGPASDATERMARGAVQVVQSALRYGDRAGVVTLGGQQVRWLGADIGQRQFYRILDIILGAAGFETATGTLAPRAAIPVGSIVIGFSTMLETQFALALIDLRKRGHTVVAVDVLEGTPLEQEVDPLVDRVWAMQRAFMYRDMATIGVDVVSWRSEHTLDQAMSLVPDSRRGHR